MKKDHNSDKNIDFGGGRLGPLFRRIFFPTLIGMIFNSVLTVIDGMFVGHGVGADGIAAVNIVAPMFMLAIGIGLMLGIGASVVAGIDLSENDVNHAGKCLSQSFLCGTLVIAVIVALSMIFPGKLVYFLGCSPALEGNAIAYLMPLAPGLIFLLFQCVGMMLIRLDGSPKYAMWAQAIPASINIALDYIMVFPLGMGVAGAAWATSISCALGGIMVIVYFLCFSEKIRFLRLECTLRGLRKGVADVARMSKIGLATFIGELAFGIMMFVGNYAFMGMLGDAGVAAYAVACYLFPVVFSMANAVAQSAQPIISFNFGARKWSRVNDTLKIALLTSVVCGLIVCALLWTCNDWAVMAFIQPGEEAYAIATHGLPLFAPAAVFFAVNIAFIGYYQSIERAWISIAYTLLRGVILLIAAFLVLPSLIGQTGLWLAIPVAELITMAVIVAGFLPLHRKMRHGH